MGIKLFPRLFLLSSLLFLSASVFSAIETHEFKNDTERDRYQSLIDEMRCPKCQNQNLAGSDSAISMDLRREIYELLKEGKSDREITDYMVARYGEFILYKPRVSPLTYVLWGAPIALFVGAVILLLVIVRQRKQKRHAADSSALSAAEAAALDVILNRNSPK